MVRCSLQRSTSVVFFTRFYGNQLDGSSDGHPEEAEEDADEPLELGQRCGVGEVAQELHQDELEDDGASEDTHENGVLLRALQNVDLLHLSRTYLVEHLRSIQQIRTETYKEPINKIISFHLDGDHKIKKESR